MRDNPTKLLHKRLTEWAVTPYDKTPKQHRQIEGRDWIEVHEEALSWLEQTVAHLTRNGVEAGEIKRLREDVANAIFASDEGLEVSSGQSVEHVTVETLRVLGMAAVSWSTPAWIEPDGQTLAEMLEAADELTTLIADASYLDDEARSYLLNLIGHFHKAITSISVFGVEEVRKLAAELVGALGIYLSDASDEQRSKASKLVTKLAEGIKKVLRIAVGAAIEGGTGFILGALTTGN